MFKNRFWKMLALTALIVMVSISGTVSAQDGEERTIKVEGQGQAWASPNIAYMNIGVEILNADVNAAFLETEQRMDAVQAYLLEQGIAEDDIQTMNYNIWQEGYYGPGGSEGERQYRVSHILRVKVSNVDALGGLISGAVGAGANTIQGINFSIEDTESLQAEARAEALANARARAEDLAANLGVTVGEVVAVQEMPTYGPVMEAAYMMGGGGGGGAPMGGSLAVQVQVQVTYELVP